MNTALFFLSQKSCTRHTHTHTYTPQRVRVQTPPRSISAVKESLGIGRCVGVSETKEISMSDPGSRMVLAVIEAEHERGTDGVILYDAAFDLVVYRMLSEFKDDQDEQEELADLLSDEENKGQLIVVVRGVDGGRAVWLIPKRFVAQMAQTTSAVLLDQRDVPVWETLKKAGKLVATSQQIVE